MSYLKNEFKKKINLIININTVKQSWYLLKTVWHFLMWLNTELKYNQQFHSHTYTPQRNKNDVHSKIRTKMFIEALLIVYKSGNNSHVYLMYRSMRYIHTVEYCSVKNKRNKLLTHITT